MHMHTRPTPTTQDFSSPPSPNMQSLQDMASLAKVSTEHLIEELKSRLHCAGKQEKKTIFIGTQGSAREGGEEGERG